MKEKESEKQKREEDRGFQEHLHHSKLFWKVTSIFTVAIGGLMVYIIDKIFPGSKGNPYSPFAGIIISFFGLFLTGLLVYFAASFRILRRNAMNKSNTELYKIHWFFSECSDSLIC